ncbi:hypothetical protein GU926_02800 [Nibribacter ruber]|uniref:Uncharacterized protein n=1 Tax=Nibribacter ruber TaxID=2698458 RepID=A0A6P1NRY1_9BACT|nr:hypothetical protein [Nibribacter ruber]QHL86427.1 hypothetical protein GU926_02800 [Nibribacter ruber]
MEGATGSGVGLVSWAFAVVVLVAVVVLAAGCWVGLLAVGVVVVLVTGFLPAGATLAAGGSGLGAVELAMDLEGFGLVSVAGGAESVCAAKGSVINRAQLKEISFFIAITVLLRDFRRQRTKIRFLVVVFGLFFRNQAKKRFSVL